MNDGLRVIEQNESMRFKFEILKAIFMACKTDELYEVFLNETKYCVSFENDVLAISSSSISSVLDDSMLPFFESKLGKVSKCHSRPNSLRPEQIIFYMSWEGFNIEVK
ncbi:MAG: hypothetical protein ACE3L7_07125 [Candidatus Pristimantibacillus sp.]